MQALERYPLQAGFTLIRRLAYEYVSTMIDVKQAVQVPSQVDLSKVVSSFVSSRATWRVQFGLAEYAA